MVKVEIFSNNLNNTSFLDPINNNSTNLTKGILRNCNVYDNMTRNIEVVIYSSSVQNKIQVYRE